MTKGAKKKPRSSRVLYEGNSGEVRVKKTGKIRLKIELPTEDERREIDEEWRLKAIADEVQTRAKQLLQRFEGRWNRKQNEEIFALVESVFQYGIALPSALRDLLRLRIVGDRNGAKKKGLQIRNEAAYAALIRIEAELPSAKNGEALSNLSNQKLYSILRGKLGNAPTTKWIVRKRKEPAYQEKVMALRAAQTERVRRTTALREKWNKEKKATRKRNVKELTALISKMVSQQRGRNAHRTNTKQK